MKVLHIAESFGGGVATAMAEYVRSTPELEHHLLYGDRTQTAEDSWLPYASSRSLGTGAKAIRTIRRAVAELQPDVVHAQSSFAGAYARLALNNRRVRIVYTPHCFAFERRDISPAARRAYYLLERALARNTEVLAGCSPLEAALGRQWLGAGHAVYVPNVARVEGVEVPARVPGQRPRIAGLGRLDAQKDPDWFAGMAAELSPNADLVWVGGGTPEAEERMRSHGVQVTGWVSRGQALAELARADCFISSAVWEGFPMALLEAQELGVPVVLRELSALVDAPGSVVAKSQTEAARLALEILGDPAARERNLAAWREYLSGNTPEVQRVRLLEAYGERPVADQAATGFVANHQQINDGGTMLTNLRQDLARAKGSSRGGAMSVLTVRMASTVLYRASHAAGQVNPLLGVAVKQLNHLVTGADIAWQAEIGPGLALFHPTGVVIGPHVRIGANCSLQQGITLGGKGGDNPAPSEFPQLGDNVSIGAGARVIGPVTVGNGAQVGANAVVTKDVPDGAVATGVPARSVVPNS